MAPSCAKNSSAQAACSRFLLACRQLRKGENEQKKKRCANDEAHDAELKIVRVKRAALRIIFNYETTVIAVL